MIVSNPKRQGTQHVERIATLNARLYCGASESLPRPIPRHSRCIQFGLRWRKGMARRALCLGPIYHEAFSKARDQNKASRKTALASFTLSELLVVLGVIFLMAALVVPGIARAKQKTRRVQCTDNLKQFGLAFRTFAINGGEESSAQAATNWQGTSERIASGQAFQRLRVMSNELSTPRLLVCPADVRVPAKDFGPGFSNTNVSYFLSLEATEIYPSMFLCGDRNLTNGLPLEDGILVLTPNRPVGWTHELHNRQGNVGLADGSVQGLANGRLPRFAVGITNRLAMP